MNFGLIAGDGIHMLARGMECIWQQPAIIAHSATLARSYRRCTGRELLPGLFNPLGLSKHLFHAPFVLVSHGTEADPVLNYGNAAALALWETSWEELTRTPSRLTAELGLADRLHLWPDKSLGNVGVSNRMPKPKEHLRWLRKWWGRISEWPC